MGLGRQVDAAPATGSGVLQQEDFRSRSPGPAGCNSLLGVYALREDRLNGHPGVVGRGEQVRGVGRVAVPFQVRESRRHADREQEG